MQKIGFTSPNVSYLFDQYSDTVLNIYSNQFELMTEYKSLLDNHKDVTSFLMANQGKSEQEIQQAVIDFDAGAKSEEQKIGPKLSRYEAATSEIWQENAKLSLQIAAQALELGAVLYTLNRQDQKAKEHNKKLELEAQKAQSDPNYQPTKKREERKNENSLQSFLAADLFSMLSSANRTYEAYKLAEVRLHLAKVANDFIKDEQAVIDISKQLQQYQNEQ